MGIETLYRLLLSCWQDVFRTDQKCPYLHINNYSTPYPYMTPPQNKPTKTGHHKSTKPTMNSYSYDYHY